MGYRETFYSVSNILISFKNSALVVSRKIELDSLI